MTRPKDTAPDAPRKKANGRKAPRNKWLKALNAALTAVVVIANIAVGLGLLASAYAHRIEPSEWPLASALAMTFGWWLAACTVLFAADLIWWRRTAWIAGGTMLACLGPIHDFSPLNIPNGGMSEEEKARSFTFMTYNAFQFLDFRNQNAPENRQLDYILRHQPDVVCLQEAEYLAPTARNAISQRQLDSLHIAYPYVLTKGVEFAIFSKYETKPINIDFPTDSFSSGDMAAWRLYIDGRVVNVFSVHLRSFSLSDADKGVYRDLVKLDSVGRKELHEVRADILPKIKDAAVDREAQIRYLEKYLAKYGGANAIVCGDFNDPAAPRKPNTARRSSPAAPI